MITKRNIMLLIVSIEEELRDLHIEDMHLRDEIAKLKVQLGERECKRQSTEPAQEAKRRGRPSKAARQPRDASGKFAKK